jgi:hypothetical protein
METKMNNGLGNLDNLFQSAQADGLTNDTMDLVTTNLTGQTMTNIGIPLDQLASNEVTLAMNIIDMSGSMSSFSAELIRAYNDDYLAAMAGSTAAEDILVSTILFNQDVSLFHGYLNLLDAPPLVRHVYNPAGSTALYDAVGLGLTNMVVYAQHLRQMGVMVRCLAIVYSDGADNASKQPAMNVRRASQELMRQEIYTLAYVGFRSGGINQTELEQLADDIGFPETLIAGLDQSELRRIFQMASTSTVRASQQQGQVAGVFI